jgi:multidrug resistance protein, MATE family
MKNEIAKLTKLAAPIAVGQVSQTLFGFIDTLMIGHVGTTELAATSFGNSVYIIFLIFGLGLTNATSPLVSRAFGRQDLHGARRILKDALLVSFVAGLMLVALCYACLFFFDRMGQAPEVAKQAKTFFAIISLTLVPSLLYQTMKQYLESINRPAVPMIVVLGGLLTNIGLNFILIFGYGPIPPLGVAGAALGTVCARICMLIAISSYVKWEESHREFLKKENPFPALSRKAVVKEYTALGIPSAFIVTFEVGAFAFSAIIVGWLGSVSLAAHQVVLSLVSITFMVPMGLATAAGILVGHELGRNDYAAATRAGTAGFYCATAFMVFSAIILAGGRNFFPPLFSKDPHVIELASTLLIVGALFQVSDGIQVVGAGVLRALKDVRLPLILTFVSYWLIALPLGYLFAFHFAYGAVGMWIGLCIGLAVVAIALTARFYIILNKQAALVTKG